MRETRRTGTIQAADDLGTTYEIAEFTDYVDGAEGLRSLRTVAGGYPVNRIDADTFDILFWNPKTDQDKTRVHRI